MSKHKRMKRAEEVAAAANESRPDVSAYVYQDEKLKTPVNIRCRYQFSERQSLILEAAADKHIKVIMIDGLWGTGKSLLATLASLRLMNEKRVSGLVYLRNPLEATTTAKVGTLPGSLEERMESYNAILYDKLGELLSRPDIDRLKKEERLECLPVGLIQGKTFAAKSVIVDEAASLSFDDLMLVISRMGEHSKLFIIGDTTFQLAMGTKSGFSRFFNLFWDQESRENGIICLELKEESDIRRSGLLRYVMRKVGAIKSQI